MHCFRLFYPSPPTSYPQREQRQQQRRESGEEDLEGKHNDTAAARRGWDPELVDRENDDASTAGVLLAAPRTIPAAGAVPLPVRRMFGILAALAGRV